ncbi:activator of (R)-2-hydroxyglutaryl-CoA dehydratase HgdC [Thermoclostridium stercorarium subsp. stercorarium DSM 8532]|jgi:predicted CoA-substrate-specific enzyme activase|uniref:Activator of (R)-2-hydroxyglutaryl-CoA dehydratase HgdC n=3 Tax=Thermoclostridium stercorarium TaxID=1510 RepID=L7VVW4_THES1|nr:acyl-CoA dehydratase activase [Thermoclostridium stercorarium]AGC69668.1 activator of (R)-2-hydroxyglutaryl-CoA dehydratase HgdC [Thermoclostridium stercorarium subsp. stercorarium DSM 8532]AGI40620.1 activase [Thermoclostridium stercorarium subsp. stercorarium DSM 8532]ANW99890.1 2-hydroxyglutaryl-CoA dehydratase [Thermoclostridium stercorarium subsp. thermolacticum DSM 2910]ANX02514.1 2-hydroxyglutaryl-CoA dehydratase [Thermoclostridium stercorarium subsp. leptospartum DSM 9219]UZQ85606.1
MYSLGIDVGSVSTNLVLLDNNNNVVEKLYIRTKGRPMEAVQTALSEISRKYDDRQIYAVGTTGSGRHIASIQVGADIIKNEITAHAVAAIHTEKDVKTVIEIGGQDSKIIIIRDGVVTDFAMNTVCAAGTGSFLDRQAERLGIPIEEFGDHALRAAVPVRIAGRCAVFAESDMIHKQQLGYNTCDIIAGLCDALVRNYLSNVAKGKEILPKVIFQGGVAANKGIHRAFESALNMQVIVPEHYDVMGALGAAILAREKVGREKSRTKFKGFSVSVSDFKSESFVCSGCSNQCEVVSVLENHNPIGYFGDRCGKYNRSTASAAGIMAR